MPDPFADIPILGIEEGGATPPPKPRLCKGDNCGDLVAKVINPVLKGAGGEYLLPEGGLPIDAPVTISKKYGSTLYRHDETPFTADFMSNLRPGTFMVGGVGGTKSHAQMVVETDDGNKAILSWKDGKAYLKSFDQAEKDIRASGWRNWTATDPLEGLEKRASKIAVGEPEGSKDKYINYAINAAQKYGVDPDIYLALINQESGFNPNAKSPTGVRGISQMTLKTGRNYGILNEQDRSDPIKMLEAGAAHLADLYREKGNWPDAVRAYNGGSDPNYVMNVGRHLPWAQSQIARLSTNARPDDPFADVPVKGDGLNPFAGIPKIGEVGSTEYAKRLQESAGRISPGDKPASAEEALMMGLVNGPAPMQEGPPETPYVPDLTAVQRATGGEKKGPMVVLGEGDQAREVPLEQIQEMARRYTYRSPVAGPDVTPLPSPRTPMDMPKEEPPGRGIDIAGQIRSNLQNLGSAVDYGAKLFGEVTSGTPLAEFVHGRTEPITKEELAAGKMAGTELARGLATGISLGLIQPPPVQQTEPMTGTSEIGSISPQAKNREEQAADIIRKAGEFGGMAIPLSILSKGGVVLADILSPTTLGSAFNKALGSALGFGAYGGGAALGTAIGKGEPIDTKVVDHAINAAIDSTLLGGYLAMGGEGVAAWLESLMKPKPGLPIPHPGFSDPLEEAFARLNRLRAEGTLTEDMIRSDIYLRAAVKLENRFSGLSHADIMSGLRKEWWRQQADKARESGLRQGEAAANAEAAVSSERRLLPSPPPDLTPQEAVAAITPKVKGDIPNFIRERFIQTGGQVENPADLAAAFLSQRPLEWTFSPQGLSTIFTDSADLTAAKKAVRSIEARLGSLNPDVIQANLDKIPKLNELNARILNALTVRMADYQADLMAKVKENQERAAAQPAPLAPEAQPDLTRPAAGRMFTDEQLRTMTHEQVMALPPDIQKIFAREAKALEQESMPRAEGRGPGLRRVPPSPRIAETPQHILYETLRRGEALPDTAGKRTGPLPGQTPEALARQMMVEPSTSGLAKEAGYPELAAADEAKTAAPGVFSIAGGGIKAPRKRPSYDLARAEESGDYRTFIKHYGPINSDSPELRNFEPEEKRMMVGLLKKGGRGLDDAFKSFKADFPHLAAKFHDEVDWLRGALDRKPVDLDTLIREYEKAHEESEELARAEGLDDETLSQARKELEERVAAEEADRLAEARREGPLSPDHPDYDPFFDYVGKPEEGPIKYRSRFTKEGELSTQRQSATRLSRSLAEVQRIHPDIDIDKASQILRAWPEATPTEVAQLVADQDLFNKVMQGNLSAAEAKQLAKERSGQRGLFEGPMPGRLFRPKSPTFYSKLERIAAEKLPGKGSASQMADILESWAAKGMFKADELKWSGIIPWLRERGGHVSRQEIVDKIREGIPEIVEIKKGEDLTEESKQDIEYAENKLKELQKLNKKLIKQVDGMLEKYGYETKERIDLINYLSNPELYPDEAESAFKEAYRIDPEFDWNYLQDNQDDINQAILDLEDAKQFAQYEPTKYSAYTLPGGSNYREVLLALPTESSNITENQFYSSHWDEPNVFLHLRLQDFPDPDLPGGKILLVDEVQSDWAREGRKRGFKDSARLVKVKEQLEELRQRIQGPNDEYIREFTPKEKEEWDKLIRERWELEDKEHGVSPFPFSRNWMEIGLKWALRHAAERGYTKLGWTTGKIQVDRYEDALRKSYTEVSSEKTPDGYKVTATRKDNGKIVDVGVFKNAQSMKDAGISGSMADKLVAEDRVTLTGQDFRMDEAWPYKLYDGYDPRTGKKVPGIPQFLNSYGKQWGARVGETEIATHGEQWKDGEKVKKTELIHTIPITDAMRESVLYEGQPMFKPKEVPSEKTSEVQAAVGAGDQAAVRNTYNPENDTQAGRELRNIKSSLAKNLDPDEWELWRNIGDATDIPGVARDIEREAAAYGLKIHWVKNFEVSGAYLTHVPGGPLIVLDQAPTVIPYRFTARHEIFHHLIKKGDPRALELVRQINMESPAFKDYAAAYKAYFSDYKLEFPDYSIAEELAADFYAGFDEVEGINLRKAFKSIGKAISLRGKMQTDVRRVKYSPRKIPPAEEEEITTGTKNAVTKEERLQRGLSEIQRQILRVEPRFEEAKRRVDSGLDDPRELAREIANKPRVMTDIEDAILKYDRMRLHNSYDDTLKTLEKLSESGDSKGIAENWKKLLKIEDDLETLEIALRHAGTQWSASGRMRQYLIKEDYSLARTILRAKVASGQKELSAADREKFTELTRQLQEAIKKSEDYEKKIKELEAELTAKKIERKVKETIAREDLRKKVKKEKSARFKSLAERINARLYHMNMVFDPETIRDLGEMARELVISGITDAREIVKEIYEELQSLTPNPDLTERDVAEAVSGYGVTSKLSKDEINVALREAKRQLRLILALEDAQAGKVPLRSGFQRDAMTDEVRSLRRQVREAMRESGLDATESRSPEEQWKTSLDAAKTHVRNWIRDLKRQIENKKREPKSKRGFEYDQELKDLKAEAKRLEQVLEEIDPKPGITDEQRVKMAIAAAKRSYDEYERRISTGDLSPRKKESKTPETPELKFARARRDYIKDIYQKMVKDSRPAKDPEEAAHKAFKTRTLKRIADLQEMLDTGNYEKSARRVLKLDREELALKNKVEELKNRIDIEIAKKRLANRTKFEKFLDIAVKVRRAIVLSGIGTIIKLTTAAAIRTVTTPTEELIGLMLAKMPYISKIADMAPREGTGFNLKAEVAAIREMFSKETWGDIIDAIKTGSGQLDRLYGKKKDFPPEVTEFFGHVHKALKVPVFRAEFYRSLQYLSDWYDKHGYDLNDETTKAKIFDGAYRNGLRVIFLSDNNLVKKHRMLINSLKNEGIYEKTLAASLEMLMPIVKTPTNIVKEIATYGFGGVYAIAKLIEKGGREGLSEDEADSIMRSLKKQILGLIFLAIGYLGFKSIGGYYQRGEKRKASDVSASGIKLGGREVPHLMLHTPLLEQLQAGSTLNRVYDAYAKYNQTHAPEDQKTNPAIAAMWATMLGIAKQTPFFDQPVRMAEGLISPDAAGKRFYQFTEGLIIPPDMRRLAKWQDMAGDQIVPRQTNTFLRVLMASVPGMRRQLPVDINSIQRMDISKIADLVEKAPEGTFKGSDKADIVAIMDRKLSDGIKKGEITKAEKDEYVKAIKSLLPIEERPTPGKKERTERYLLEHPEVRPKR